MLPGIHRELGKWVRRKLSMHLSLPSRVRCLSTETLDFFDTTFQYATYISEDAKGFGTLDADVVKTFVLCIVTFIERHSGNPS